MGVSSFTIEQEQFLIVHGSQMSRAELTTLFNQTFGTTRKMNTIRAFCVRNKVPSPNGNGRFTSETSPRWQKGLSKEEFKRHYTDQSFDQMVKPMGANKIKYHIGEEIIRHGLPMIVVSEEFGKKSFADRLMMKDKYVWEKATGRPIEKHHMLIHIDGDPMNCELDNLRCVPTSYRAFFRWNNWWDAPKEIKEVAISWCDLHYAIQKSKENIIDNV